MVTYDKVFSLLTLLRFLFHKEAKMSGIKKYYIMVKCGIPHFKFFRLILYSLDPVKLHLNTNEIQPELWNLSNITILCVSFSLYN